MGFEFSAAMFRHWVIFCPRTSGINSGGGKISLFDPVGLAIPCNVQEESSRTKPVGESQDVTETTYQIATPTWLPGKPKDQMSWLDPEGTELRRIALTTSSVHHDPDGTLWVAHGVIVE